MELIIKRAVAQRLGYKAFVPYGVPARDWESSYHQQSEIELARLSGKKIDELEALLESFKKAQGVAVLLHDIRLWKGMLREGLGTGKARTVRQFKTVLEQYLRRVPGPRLYKRSGDGELLAYYVEGVEYKPPNSRDNSPPATVMNLVYYALDQMQRTSHYWNDECRNVPVTRLLAEAGYSIETPELREQYEATLARWLEVTPQIGKQYWAHGMAEKLGDSNYWREKRNLRFGREGDPYARVVVDLFLEPDEKQGRSKRFHVDPYFWPNIDKGSKYDVETDEDPDELDEDTTLERPEVEQLIPTHPWVIAYDLQKHERVRAHVEQLEEYKYDEQLADKLILPDDQKRLVKLLVDTNGGVFRDIVKGKGSGAVVLLTGAPGTGKTLTAEVYAESEKRALYSVQCAQLGTDPEELEAALLKVFERAARWNAVMLLDEADVYVRERGGDLQQNAIVGVFLRVLEYQGSTLFLTTNRPDDVDDAIASRCVARLSYRPPTPEDAGKIWWVLAKNAGLLIAEKTIEEVVAANPEMTGRDIKNILKLTSLMGEAKVKITAEDVRYAQQFKPTGGA